jgi:hypothetical protein
MQACFLNFLVSELTTVAGSLVWLFNFSNSYNIYLYLGMEKISFVHNAFLTHEDFLSPKLLV